MTIVSQQSDRHSPYVPLQHHGIFGGRILNVTMISPPSPKSDRYLPYLPLQHHGIFGG
ncbi:hypothetical protein [Cylindrospermopsis raciborskii]|uniref:hypothetical protein n=1 Tax=Cylindrospermopsis raciborskii TaxID=77022 RepID=UPI001F3628E7|nr:hypothetical protein [Cylindrospermopsis raciborskii]